MSAIGWTDVLLSVSESFLGTAAEVKLPVNCAGGQSARPSRLRTSKGTLGNVQPHRENNFSNDNIMASVTRTIYLMMSVFKKCVSVYCMEIYVYAKLSGSKQL